MTPEQLEAIKRRAEAATEGPWIVDHDARVDGCDHVVLLESADVAVCFLSNRSGDPDWQENNGAFIAAAREDIPALVAEVERLRAEVEDNQGWKRDRKSLAIAEGILEDVGQLSLYLATVKDRYVANPEEFGKLHPFLAKCCVKGCENTRVWDGACEKHQDGSCC